MSKKSIVIIRNNPITPDVRVEKEANCLIKAGYTVCILAWDRDNKYKVKETFLDLKAGQAKIYRFGIPAIYGGGIKSLKAFSTFQKRVLFWLINNRNNYSHIHACDIDTAITGYWLAKIFNKKFIFDIFDYRFTFITGKYRSFKKIIVKLQHMIINNADGTIICSEKRIEQIRGSHPRRLAIIHNSPPSIEMSIPIIDLNKSKTKIAYIGILQDNRFLKEMADIIKQLPECELHIGGFGVYEEYFKNMANICDNIFYYGKIQYNETLKLEKSCDIITAIYDPAIGNHHYAAPNKFYEALMLGKPLIMVRNTGMDCIVEKFDIGEVINFNSESLKNGIKNLINRQHEWPIIANRMQHIYRSDYSWEKMESRLIEFYSFL